MSAPMLSAWKTSAFPDFSNTGCGSSLNGKKGLMQRPTNTKFKKVA